MSSHFLYGRNFIGASEEAMMRAPEPAEYELTKKEPKSAITRRRITNAAARVFRERGYNDAKLIEIAKHADMQAGSLYYHFSSKDDLAWTVMEIGLKGVQDRAQEYVEALGPDADPIDRLVAAFSGHLSYMLEEADYAAASERIRLQVPEKIRSRLRRRQRVLVRTYTAMFEEAQDQGYIHTDYNLSALRQFLISALNSAPEWFNPRGLPPGAIVEQLGSMMRHGLAHPPELTVPGD